MKINYIFIVQITFTFIPQRMALYNAKMIILPYIPKKTPKWLSRRFYTKETVYEILGIIQPYI